MKFVPMIELLNLAKSKKIAYGAFEFWSYETARAAVEAGSELNFPVILQCGQTEIDMMGGFEATAAIASIAAMRTTVPVALHLDHSLSFEACNEAIKAGFTSVMIDLSAQPLEENIAGTRKVVERAHPEGVTVEAELGRLVGEEGSIIVKGPEAAQTDPQEAKRMVEQTGIDCLAVSIGTQHGEYRFDPVLNIKRLNAIANTVDIPLVLHGGSGTPMGQVQEAIRNGITKINICTDIVLAMAMQYVATQAQPNFKYTTVSMFTPSYDAAKQLVISKMKAFSLQ